MTIMTRSRTKELERLASATLPMETIPLMRSVLTCPRCSESLQDPTTLSCGHTFCSGCIEYTGLYPVCSLPECAQCGHDRHPKLDVVVSKIISVTNDFIHSSPEDTSSDQAKLAEVLHQELECQLCYMMVLDPVTSSCGHTTCKQCILRSLDYSDKCPVCRHKLPSYQHFSKHSPNRILSVITAQLFPQLIAQRQESVAYDLTNRVDETPLFICSLVFPKMPCYLHVFESRYRLMIRRCVESSRQRFGMVLHTNQGVGFHEYGTMVEARNIELVQDGRYMVDAIGSFRFRIIERGIRDGYNIGRVERIDDEEDDDSSDSVSIPSNSASSENASPEGEDYPQANCDLQDAMGSYPECRNLQPELTTSQLQAECVMFVEALKSSSAPWLYQRLNATVGPMPSDPSDFSFWMASIVPLDEQEKYAILPITSTRRRLEIVLQWVRRIKEQWWFGRMCAMM